MTLYSRDSRSIIQMFVSNNANYWRINRAMQFRNLIKKSNFWERHRRSFARRGRWFATSCSRYIEPFIHALSTSTTLLGAARWNTAASFPKWHFAKTNFLASAISDHAARSRNTAGDRDCGTRRCFDITKDPRNFCEIQSTTVKRLQKPSASKPWKRERLRTLCRLYST